ncbi:MAG: hypothetical protein J6Y32_07190, partial [Bacteroidales bacterium]|nr:hypothetical protein [Bacteroidales bacterium]
AQSQKAERQEGVWPIICPKGPRSGCRICSKRPKGSKLCGKRTGWPRFFPSSEERQHAAAQHTCTLKMGRKHSEAMLQHGATSF